MLHLFRPPLASIADLKQRQFEWHGHRGARGLFPENTIPAMTGTIEHGINWLEIDIVVSKDRQIIVSHDPYFHPAYCSDPQGKPITAADKSKYNLFELTADEIRQFDCGLRQNAAYPQQQTLAAYKPTFLEMVGAVDDFCIKNNHPLPDWNIEIKSESAGYNIWTIEPSEMIDLLLKDLDELDLRKRCQVQSFDKNPLRELRQRAPEIRMAVLTYDLKGVDHHVQQLGFTPETYAPFYPTVFASTIKKAHQKGMKVVPWTVNSTWWMRRLIYLGVDGIITDYPNKIEAVVKK
ncbi:MAG: glycerophosphodiester phosphodiesterase family protein [Saprospiraceae bacterium]